VGKKERENIRNNPRDTNPHLNSNKLVDIAINNYGPEFAFSEAVAVWEKSFYSS